ncbi:hypothetical protein SISNIDRAFT_485386 [Sistotremastrum niveocremeum HHB9708]|uniref:Uncharacterized protein n=1 Tax=Sistotremastrum niveocremeum HHB9708 TaxID=1314777 RepID=A0A164V3I6_9AGAM|nr:hypothetical protein SISNIDRAFT_485386 [Sistotremastrum niveocremeum HHB9708]
MDRLVFPTPCLVHLAFAFVLIPLILLILFYLLDVRSDDVCDIDLESALPRSLIYPRPTSRMSVGTGVKHFVAQRSFLSPHPVRLCERPGITSSDGLKVASAPVII